MKTLKYPDMRVELLSTLQSLADPVHQQRAWVEGHPIGGIQHDEFDYAVHFLFDDSTLSKDPHGNIGWILIDAAEADRVATLVQLLERLFEKHGTTLSDAQYMALPEWHLVVDAARAVLAVMPEGSKAPNS